MKFSTVLTILVAISLLLALGTGYYYFLVSEEVIHSQNLSTFISKHYGLLFEPQDQMLETPDTATGPGRVNLSPTIKQTEIISGEVQQVSDRGIVDTLSAKDTPDAVYNRKQLDFTLINKQGDEFTFPLTYIENFGSAILRECKADDCIDFQRYYSISDAERYNKCARSNSCRGTDNAVPIDIDTSEAFKRFRNLAYTEIKTGDNLTIIVTYTILPDENSPTGTFQKNYELFVTRDV